MMKHDLIGLKYNLKELWKRIYRWFKSPVFRVHILKILATITTILLIISAYHVHVTYADDFLAFQAIRSTTNLNRTVSRGIIFDRNMVPLVTNETVSVITYHHIPNIATTEIRRVANELSAMIHLDYETDIRATLMFRDRQELFLMLNEEYVRSLVDHIDTTGMDNAAFHLLMIDQITPEHVASLTHADLQAHAIFVRMFQGAGTTDNIIKENPTELEIARVVESLVNLPGVSIGTDWTRYYPSTVSRDFFGNVTTAHQGIPRDREPYFLIQGYAANARVGTSQLERSLHQFLSGFQYQYSLIDGVRTEINAGMPGFQASLNLDSELQAKIEAMVAESLITARESHNSRRYLRETYVVVSNPHTGAVLAMVGVVLDEDEDGELVATMNPLGTIHNANPVGSAVKGASLMVGYTTGTTTVGRVRHDSPINILGSNPLHSWITMGNVNDIDALAQSSNVYFFRQTMEIANARHAQGGRVYNWSSDAWDIYRNFFHQVGLGSYTGIELSNESRGFTSTETFIELLFLSIGQADTYTTMQLAQFGGVLATRGQRMQKQLVQNIYLPSSDQESLQLIRPFEPNLLNQIILTDEQWDQIAEGHRQTVSRGGRGMANGTAFGIFSNTNFEAAGKTGTAETFLRNERGQMIDNRGNLVGTEGAGSYVRINNSTFVGYAPFDNPQIVVSVVSPQAEIVERSRVANIAAEIARDAMQIYFDLQLARLQN